METIRNAANAAASYVGYDQTAGTDKADTGNTLGELVQDRNSTGTTRGGLGSQNTHSSTSHTGIEPVSGQLGSGTAGQPYDAGNDEAYSRNASGLTGQSTHNTSSGLGNTTGQGNNTTGSTLGGIASSLTGNSTSSGYGNNTSSGYGSSNTGSNLGGPSSTRSGEHTSSGYGNSSTGSTLGGIVSSLTGSNTSSGHGNNTSSGYGSNTTGSNPTGTSSTRTGDNTSSGYGNSSTGSTLGGMVASLTGSNTSSGHNTSSGPGNNTGYQDTNTYGRETGNHGSSSGIHSHGLGSDSGAAKSSDRYLFNARNAPGGGGQHSKIVDDFTDSNIHHEGSGSGVGGLRGADANSGKGGVGSAGSGLGSGYTGSDHSGHTHHSTSGTGHTSGTGLSSTGTERSRKPGFERMGSGLSAGNASHGLNSGAPRESIGTKLERKGEEAGLAAAGAGATGYGASHSGREPVSGQRGSGIAGEPYDQGNKYDGESYQNTGSSTRDGQVSQATSGLGNLNLRDGQTENAYPHSTQPSGNLGGSNDPSKSNSGLNLVGLSGRNDGTSDRHTATSDRDIATSDRHTGTSSAPGFHGYTGPNSTNENRLAEHGRDFGATAPRNENDIPGSGRDARIDECEVGHHNAHPIGEHAHEDGTHKPTFLNYHNDKFGVPVARGD